MKKILLFVWMLGLGFVAQAQDKKEDALEALRIAFISKQLELTPAEAEKFWPVYNKYQGDLRRMMQEHRDKKGSELDWEEKLLNMRKQYKPEFTKCISEQKFDRLIRAERTWGDMLRKELQRRREAGERPGMGRPPMVRPRQ
ncbi:hypothetical protein [Phnomibacter ginsenosidimutans]|uniref:Sensor of ECF-type sigma factor n=1 Tax=Phnomibacter ginsenosidimutans TaxID=2676868 RepID=A0A6I6GHI5_9BACT|nr:hypothetical protein [Phnomibacter ginsenosidimutans]QGW27158.1 hypothetical protein GLV81_02720 [Phnomibacter ginsenosidimutans]